MVAGDGRRSRSLCTSRSGALPRVCPGYLRGLARGGVRSGVSVMARGSDTVCRRRPGAPHATRASLGRDGDNRALECPRRSDRTLPSYIRDRFQAGLRFIRSGARDGSASPPSPRRRARFDAGAARAIRGRYSHEVSALQWVHATLLDTALVAYELVHPPLTPEMRERYYVESRRLGALFGIPLDAQPLDAPAFARYVGSMLASEALAVGTDARRIGSRVLSGAGRVWVPDWYRDLTAALLPEPLRSAFELPFGDEERRRAARAVNLIRRLYPALPARLRYVAPYQEALSRLSGRQQPDLVTRTLNHLWIGRSSMSD